jgi:peptidylprolyl isomerase domain and WD repeat-containing protein 1
LFLSGVVTCEGLKFLNKSIIVFQVLHTSMGDIHLRLYPEECPKTVENFTTHCRNGYYDNLIFHRVIKGFMIQTGDPLGDGTGGQSIWGTEFEDEFHKRYVYFFPI